MPWRSDSDLEARVCRWEVSIAGEVFQELKKLARKAGVSIKHVVLAAHLRVMALLAGQEEAVTGVVANGRVEAEDGERVLGLFLNTLPFRLQLHGGNLDDLVRQTAAAEYALLPYRRFPLAELQRMNGGSPLFVTLFNFIHFHVYRQLYQISGLRMTGGGFEQTNFAFVANFQLDPLERSLHLGLSYDEALIEKDQIEAIAGYYRKALECLAYKPEARYEWSPCCLGRSVSRSCGDGRNGGADCCSDLAGAV